MLHTLTTAIVAVLLPLARRAAPYTGSLAGIVFLTAAAWTGLGPPWGLATAGLGSLALEWRVNET